MRVLVTPSARRQLLSAIVRLRDRDRAAARRYVDDVGRRLRHLAEGPGTSPEMGPPAETAAAAEDEHRFFYRVRNDVVWVIATWGGDERIGAE